MLEGKMVVSGGAYTTNPMTVLDWSYPVNTNSGAFNNAWRVRTSNRPADGNEYYVDVYALCVYPNTN